MRAVARLPRAAFLDAYRERIVRRRIEVGCSFAPEVFSERGNHDRDFPLLALRYAVEECGIADIRLGLRWNTLVPEPGVFSEYYAPYLDYCFASEAVQHLVLDIGPIKTFRWPEVHVPEHVLARVADVPAVGAEIEPTSALAEESYAHAERTLAYLAGWDRGSTRVSFACNEPFNPFGPQRWTLSEAYLVRLVEMILAREEFADAGFVVNSSEGRDLERIARWFGALVAARPELRGRLTSGYDLYPFVPGRSRASAWLMGLGAVGWRGARRNVERARAAGYRIEVTEAQAEPWGAERAVGNSLAHYQHVIAESVDRILDPAQDTSIVRMWGIEHQVERVLRGGDGAAENREILRLTAEINSLRD